MKIELSKEQAQLIAYAIEKLVNSYSQGTQVRAYCEAMIKEIRYSEDIDEGEEDIQTKDYPDEEDIWF